ncbi:MAG: NUDIX domain-containing protein [Bacteroidetes bacterium]|jgi:translation initiation factor 2B subunit (eIF-2B alpha/beta/delta family)|nr:NUDIX domain-containing protein [Bacteroidota bacterium]
MTETHVVTCFLRHDSEVLLLRRSDAVGSYQGQWGAVAGHAEGDPDHAARQEIAEETGLLDAVAFVRSGAPFPVEDADLSTRWIAHPYLFDCDRRDVRLNDETTEHAWDAPTEILRRETVPKLWTSYEHVAPTLETIRDDVTHGSAYLSLRALEVLRDAAGFRAAGREGGPPLSELARDLAQVRSSMTVIANRIHRAMYACRDDRTPACIEREAHDAIGRAIAVEADVARHAANYIAGRTVLTLSRSGTVVAALRQADPPPRILIAASAPGREGAAVAEALSYEGIDVTLLPDAAVATILARGDVDVVLVGADTVLPNGDVVNKVGTRAAALSAHTHQIPCYVATATDKVSTDATLHLEDADPADVYDGDAILNIVAPRFEVTPMRYFSGLITEDGLVGMNEVGDIAYELRGYARWQEAWSTRHR